MNSAQRRKAIRSNTRSLGGIGGAVKIKETGRWLGSLVRIEHSTTAVVRRNTKKRELERFHVSRITQSHFNEAEQNIGA